MTENEALRLLKQPIRELAKHDDSIIKRHSIGIIRRISDLRLETSLADISKEDSR